MVKLYKFNKYTLDKNQSTCIYNKDKHLLVVAGAGSGKTLTILGKIDYLIKNKINSSDILCISFTNESSNGLKNKIKDTLNIDMNVYTFHKLSMEILKNKRLDIASDDLLQNVVRKFLSIDLINNKKLYKKLLNIYDIKDRDYLDYLNKKGSPLYNLEKTIICFIKLFKCNNNNLYDFNIFLFKALLRYKTYYKEKVILTIILNIYIEYTRVLKDNNEIDFDDMIIEATKEVQKNGYKHIKYIIIDEYQDTSYIRFNLIKEILNYTDASLMVVGDDFQSIYKFTGCNIDLFINFNRYFSDAKVLKLETTYRNSQELINIAGSFVMKNKTQIRKNLVSSKSIDKPINIVYVYRSVDTFINTILKIYYESNGSILVLGRNNNDIYEYIDSRFSLKDNTLVYKENPLIKIRYMSVHKSKGLEDDNVILINMENKVNGFPNKQIDDEILRFVSIKDYSYRFAEERRLFYVALTRSKNKVYILTPTKNKSYFVKEIISEYKEYINYIK